MRLAKYILISSFIHFLLLSFFSTNASSRNVSRKKGNLPVRVVRNDQVPKEKKHPEGRLIFKPNPELNKDGQGRAKDSRDRQTVSLVSVRSKGDLVSTKFRTRRQYEKYLRQSLAQADLNGIPVPDLYVAYRDIGQILEVIDYFGLKLMAFPQQGSSEKPYFVEVKDAEKKKFLYHDHFDFSGYSNRVKDRRGHPSFDRLAHLIAEKYKLDEDRIMLVSLTPNRVDKYFEWKQIETARKAGIDPKDVKVTYGKYYKSNFGGWILIINRLLLKNGEMVDILRDFELNEISA